MTRVRSDDCGILTFKVPWARPGSGFTLLIKALAMMKMKAMPVRVTARIVGEHDTRLWRVLAHYVLQARAKLDLSSLQAVGLDETASRRGHNYATLFADLDQHQVIFATEGKDTGTIEAFKVDLILHGGDPKAVEEFCCDMSPAYISGITEHFPHAELTFDKYHVLKIINEAVDEVRRQEQRERPELSGSRYAWLTKPEKQTRAQAARIRELLASQRKLKMARAYHIRLNYQDFWQQTSEQAGAYLKGWYYWATHSRLEPIIEAAATNKRHWHGVLRWFKTRIRNGILEAINRLVQAAKARARGYRTTRNLIMMIYLIAGKLEFNLPRPY